MMMGSGRWQVWVVNESKEKLGAFNDAWCQRLRAFGLFFSARSRNASNNNYNRQRNPGTGLLKCNAPKHLSANAHHPVSVAEATTFLKEWEAEVFKNKKQDVKIHLVWRIQKAHLCDNFDTIFQVLDVLNSAGAQFSIDLASTSSVGPGRVAAFRPWIGDTMHFGHESEVTPKPKDGERTLPPEGDRDLIYLEQWPYLQLAQMFQENGDPEVRARIRFSLASTQVPSYPGS